MGTFMSSQRFVHFYQSIMVSSGTTRFVSFLFHSPSTIFHCSPIAGTEWEWTQYSTYHIDSFGVSAQVALFSRGAWGFTGNPISGAILCSSCRTTNASTDVTSLARWNSGMVQLVQHDDSGSYLSIIVGPRSVAHSYNRTPGTPNISARYHPTSTESSIASLTYISYKTLLIPYSASRLRTRCKSLDC